MTEPRTLGIRRTTKEVIVDTCNRLVAEHLTIHDSDRGAHHMVSHLTTLGRQVRS